jgi:hypothetical protein
MNHPDLWNYAELFWAAFCFSLSSPSKPRIITDGTNRSTKGSAFFQRSRKLHKPSLKKFYKLSKFRGNETMHISDVPAHRLS